VDLGLTDEQHALARSFRDLLRSGSGPEQVRAAEPGGFDPVLWRTLLDTGVVTMAVSEAQGGWGASLLDLTVVAEEVGRAAAPAPVIEAQVAARLLSRLRSPSAREALDRVLDGTRLVTLALRPPQDGVALLTPAGSVCDAVVVCRDGRVLVVPVADDIRRPVANLGSAPLADLTIGAPGERATGEAASEEFETAIDEWLILTAAALVGMSAAVLELACAYVIERRAFGAAIATYQAVAHPLAEDATRTDGARLLTQKAAWAVDHGAPRGRELAAMALAFASETAERTTYDALHVHGGYGFMVEYDVQLYWRRARGWARVWGDAEAGYRRASAARYPVGAGGVR
jgi:alkylation response protein AidB-like acyl-CoA dehydrogenase